MNTNCIPTWYTLVNAPTTACCWEAFTTQPEALTPTSMPGETTTVTMRKRNSKGRLFKTSTIAAPPATRFKITKECAVAQIDTVLQLVAYLNSIDAKFFDTRLINSPTRWKAIDEFLSTKSLT